MKFFDWLFRPHPRSYKVPVRHNLRADVSAEVVNGTLHVEIQNHGHAYQTADMSDEQWHRDTAKFFKKTGRRNGHCPTCGLKYW